MIRLFDALFRPRARFAPQALDRIRLRESKPSAPVRVRLSFHGPLLLTPARATGAFAGRLAVSHTARPGNPLLVKVGGCALLPKWQKSQVLG
jgi:hypothetical protein